MKIIHCLFTMDTGGTQMLVVDILNKLNKDGNSVSLIIVNNEWNQSIINSLSPQISLYYLSRKQGSKSPLPIVKLNLLLFKIRPDIIHCHESNMGNLIIPFTFNTILTIHDVGWKIKKLNRYKQLIAISRAVASDVKTRYKKRIPVINNGVSMSSFKHRENFILTNSENFRIVQVSRLMYKKKGQDILIKALYVLVNEKLVTNIFLEFIGDGDSLSYLRRLVTSLHLEPYVSFAGNKNKQWINENLCGYHLLVQPSRYEGFGLTVLEGIAAGIPVVAADLDGPAEIFENCDYKFLFEKENVEECANKIFQVIGLYKQQKIKSIVDNTFTTLSKAYSVNSMIESYFSLYGNVIENKIII